MIDHYRRAINCVSQGHHALKHWLGKTRRQREGCRIEARQARKRARRQVDREIEEERTDERA